MSKRIGCLLGAFAVPFFVWAEAQAWFDAGISSYTDWPTDGSNMLVEGQGSWTGTAHASFGESKLKVDSLSTTGQLQFGPAVEKSAASATLTYSFTTRFTAKDGYPEVDPDAKCGISVFTDTDQSLKYCGLVKNPSGDGNAWMTLTGAEATVDDEVDLTIAMKKEGGKAYVQYAISGTVLGGDWLEIADVAEMTGAVAFGGTGDVSALSATAESAEPLVTQKLTIPALANVTIAHVKVAGVEIAPTADGTYVVEQGSVVTVTFAPAAGWALDVSTMTFAVKADMELPETGRPNAINVAATITINEVMAKNGVTLRTGTGFEGLDWVELYNSGDADVDLTGWFMGNDPTKKASKWTPIEGRCIVPAKGFKIVWFDGDGLCTTWADDEAHVAANLSTDAYKHTVFLASTANANNIVQQIKLPGGVKDISYGRGHLSRTLVSANASAEYKVGDGAWKPVDGPVGMSAVAGGFTVKSYKINKQVSNMDVVDACLLDPSTWSQAYENTAEAIAFMGSGSTGNFDTSLYSGFPGAQGEHMIYLITGTVMIPEAGDWTFAVGSDDGFSAKLTRLGKTYGWESRGTRGYAQSTATFNLAAGSYEVEIRYFNATGGLGLDFSVAKGRLAFDADKFQLVGLAGSPVVHAGALGAQVAADVSTEMVGQSKTLDWKTSFALEDVPNAADVFRLAVKYADGFTAKVNGKTVATVAAAGARPAAAALQPETFEIPASAFVPGANTLEITAENDAIDDTEFYLSAELVRDIADDLMVYFTTPTPGAANGGNGKTGFTPKVAYSVAHGWKDAAFDLELSCPENETAVIYYTLDGTSPKVGAETTYRYDESIRIEKTTVVRAAVPDVDSILQIDTSATYLFYDDVIAQDATVPAGFPADAAVNSQKMLYGMAKAITEGDDDTRARLRRGFTENTRTVSLVIDPKNLFDGANGIYVNATGNGRTWERQTMAEQINPAVADGSDDFSIAAGLRIRGAFSRGAGNPKHSFRLFFRSEYGMGTLKHKLFGDEGAGEFEKIDFRTSQNYAWAQESDGDTFIHETFSRDSQGAMGSTYNRSRYYNLFINGVYWGLYQTEERVDQNYCESYNGGVAENYDVVRTSQPGYNTGIVEGETAGWTELWRLTTQEGYGEGHEANYYKVRGLNPDGTRNPAYPVLLNVTNLIEHILTVHFAQDADAPVNSSGMANNIIAFRNRVDGEGAEDGFLWNRHDAEHSLGYGGGANALGALIYGTEEHVNPNRDLFALGNFNPNLLNYELLKNAEYRRVFSDLVYKHMVREGGALTAPVAEARYRARMAELDDVIVCESARWGHQRGHAYDRVLWLRKCNDRINFINQRLGYLIPEYQRRGWYTSVDPAQPVNGLGSAVVDGQTIAADDRLYLPGGVEGATVYYTTDGTDPMNLADASVAAGATAYTGGSPVTVDVPAFAKGASWKYSDAGALPAADWAAADYDDSAWTEGAARLGFAGSGTFATKLDRYVDGGSSGTQVTTYYFRKTIELPETAPEMTTLKVNIDIDDAYVAYVNGVEALRENLPTGTIGYGTFASSANNGLTGERTLTFPAGTLKAGANVIAFEVHQCNATSSDAWFDLALAYPQSGSTEGGLVVPPEGLTLTMRVYKDGQWSALTTVKVKGELPKATPAEALRLAAVYSSTLDDGKKAGDGDGSEFIVLTNITEGVVSLKDVKLVAWNSAKKTEADASLTITFADDLEILPGKSLTLDKATWFGSGKLTNSEVGLKLYAGESCFQEARVNADWWNSACDGTGAYFVAKAFGAEVMTIECWKPSVDLPQDWPEDPETEITEKTTAADLGITEGEFKNATPAELRKIAAWAKRHEVVFGTPEIPAEAFLLNCAPNETAVEHAKVAFKFTAIVPGETPAIDGDYNGTVTVLGAETLVGPWEANKANAKFYKATLTR